jgi:hypothetical protein
MTRDLTLEGQVQRILNDLLTEGLIPFALNVALVTRKREGYIVYFYDSGIQMAVVPLVDGLPLDELVRSAVLARVGKMSGPLVVKRTRTTD